MNISVVGLGHTGLVVAAVFAARGHQVCGHDIESGKLREISAGRSPFYEPGLEKILGEGLQAGRLVVKGIVDECLVDAEVVFLAVGTPTGSGNQPDLAEFWSAVGQVVPLMSPQTVLAVKSTVPLGTTDELIARFADRWPKPSPVVTVPEFLRQGTAVEDFLKPDRVVFGSRSPEALVIMRRVYQPLNIPSERIIECLPTAAELIKHAANAFLATKISFANQLANLCGKLDLDYTDVRRGLAADPRIGDRFLHAGLGFGGSCFPKDVAALIETGKTANSPMTLIETALVINRTQIEHVATLAREMLDSPAGKRILQLGITYKSGTDDLRGSPALELAFRLAREGAEILCFDPGYTPTAVGSDHVFKIVNDPVAAAANADLILIATEWLEFVDLPWSKLARSMKTAKLLDARNLLDPEKMAAAGFTYRGIGRAAPRRA